MRVLLISHTCQSCTEGQPKARALARMPDVELRVLVPDRWKHYGTWRAPEIPATAEYRYEIGKVRWPWCGPAQFYLHWYPRLREMMESFRPDIIDLWEEPWGLVSAQVCWLRNRVLPEAKIICETEQNIDKRLPPPFEWFRSYTLRNADFAVARSDEALAVLRTKGYGGPAQVVSNGVDADLFWPMDREQCRRQLGIVGFVVGFVGRFVEEKGLTDLIDAVAQCPPSVNLLFVGSGPQEDALKSRARELGLSDRVRFLGARPLGELPAVMNAVDVVALPSRTTGRWKEQFGRVLIEANACETPVIGSDSGAIPEVIGGGGLIARERDPASLAAAIRRLMDDPARCRELGMQGRRQVLARYTWQRVAEQMHAIYHRIERNEFVGSALADGIVRHPRAARWVTIPSAKADPADLSSSQSSSTTPEYRERGPRRILFMDHTAKLGGGEIALLNMVGHLDFARCSPHVVLFSDGPLRERLQLSGIPATIVPLSTSIVGARKDRLGMRSFLRLGDVLKTVLFIRRLAQTLKELRADLVHTNSLKSDILGGLAGKWAGVPVLWHVRDRIADDYLPGRVASIFRGVCRIVPDFVIANSAATLSTLQLPTGARSRMVHDGTGLEVLPASGPESNGELKRIVLVGRICRWKGQHVFLTAAAKVRLSFPSARFQIVGSALFEEQDYQRELHGMVRELKLEECVEFTGFLDDVMEVMSGADILVHASITGEPFGQVVIEGMAAGKPVVATNGGGIPEIVMDGVTGLLVPMGDADQMAAAICHLLSNPKAARSMGELGRQRVMDHFRIQDTVSKVQGIYDELLTGRIER